MEKAEENKINIILLFLIIISPILILILIFVIQKNKLYEIEKNFYSRIEEVTIKKYECCDDFIINEDNNFSVEINMNENFNNLNYEEKEKIIKELNSNINTEFHDYLDRVSKIDENCNISNLFCKTYFYLGNDCYEYDSDKNIIKKNGNKYNLIISLREEILDKIKDTGYAIYLDNVTNTNSLKNILSIKNTDECKKEILYLSAIALYDGDNFEKAIERFNLIDSNYKNKKQYIKNAEIYNNIQGTWYGAIEEYGTITGHKWIIKGKHCYNIYDDLKSINAKTRYYFIIHNNKYYISEKPNFSKNDIVHEVQYENNTLIYEIFFHRKMTLKKQNNNTDLPITKYIKEPSIGMTKSEVENSTWGKPEEINKTTTKYGIHEQWVYLNYKYIYFDNGVVSAIQE